MEDDVALSVGDLVSMFEAFEETSDSARKQSERDRDYHDNIQLTAEELKTLKKRGQPPYIDNRIKTKVDYLVGLEKQQRINPRALPRTPMHEAEADAATQALNYVADKENFDYKRSAIWRNLLIEGAGGMGVTVKQDRKGEWYVCLKRIPWDRMFWDPHSAEPDFSDAGYLGTVQWMDYDDALQMYGADAQEILDATLSSVSISDTFDDKPRFNVWADKKRKRVRICAIWIKRGEDWHFAEFTKGGILKAGPSPYVNDQGESDCELIFQSAYVDRENNRFGLVREMILLQDAINKRNSKALHQLNTAQIVMTSGAVEDVEKARREAARPDGVIVVNPGMNGGLDQNFQFNTRSDLATGQVALLQEAKQSIDLKGPNATQMGEKAQGSAAASGKAILASQQGGMISLGDLLDNLRHLDIRTFRAIWNRIRQFWTAEKWVRVTDDDRNVKWVGINVDPARLQMASPEQQRMIAGIVGNVAELDCDIIIDESPLSPLTDQFESLAELRKSGVMIPDKAIVRAMPNFSGKQMLMKEMDEPNPVQQMGQQLQMAGAKAEVEKTTAETRKIVAETQQIGAGEDPRGPLIEAAARQSEAQAKQMEGRVKLAGIVAKSEADQRMAALNIEGAHLDNTGKELANAGKLLDIQRQREAPPPQPSKAA